MDIKNFIDVVSLVSTICHHNVACIIIRLLIICTVLFCISFATISRQLQYGTKQNLVSYSEPSPANIVALQIASFLLNTNARFKLFTHQTYMPDVALNYFYLFPKLKKFMTGHKFADDEEVICTANGRLKSKITILLHRFR